jgi:hypothetical protein
VEKQHAAFIVQWIFMLWVVASFIILIHLIILPSGEKGFFFFLQDVTTE